jgi:hypothetical protein
LRERQQQQMQQRQQQQQTKTQNSFSPLSALGTDAEETLAATPAEHTEVLALALANAVGQGDWARAESLKAAIAAQHGAKIGSHKGLAKGTPGGLSSAALNLLTDEADSMALLGAVSSDGRGGRVVEAIVDSGAVHSVTPPGLFPGPTVPSPWSRAGRGYRAANGTGIRNLGQVTVKFATATGDRCSIPFQVAEVEQPLLSVAHLAAAGNRVELGNINGRVVNTTTGRAIALEKRGGVYIMKMHIAEGAAPAPFRRQGA